MLFSCNSCSGLTILFLVRREFFDKAIGGDDHRVVTGQIKRPGILYFKIRGKVGIYFRIKKI